MFGDPLLHPSADGRLDIALLLGQKMINTKQLQRSGSSH
jgi:hypothetical protein